MDQDAVNFVFFDTEVESTAGKSHDLWCQNCVRYPRKPRSNAAIYGDSPMHIVVAEAVDRKCVDTCRWALLRAAGFALQACSFNHSDISPFRINGLRAA